MSWRAWAAVVALLLGGCSNGAITTARLGEDPAVGSDGGALTGQPDDANDSASNAVHPDAAVELSDGAVGSSPKDSGSTENPLDASPPIDDPGDPPDPTRDAGPLPAVDAGPPPAVDAGPPPAVDAGPPPAVDAGSAPPVTSTGTWPTANAYSWNGLWTPSFPMNGLFDNEYFDGHRGPDGWVTPILPPGAWDWNDANDDTANWNNFDRNIGEFAARVDASGHQYGWTLVPNTPDAVDFSGAAMYFEGSPGTDYIDCGPHGDIGSYGSGNLADGPDVLIFNSSRSLDFRTGATSRGYVFDDDLVIAGCDVNAPLTYDIRTTTIHTGPGNDWVFVRDLSAAAVDLGNPEGRTDADDVHDGNDLVVVRGNTEDFRVLGGHGDDVAVWYIDENVRTDRWLGPNFFGGGGWGAGVWADTGTDRLVLAVPDDTDVVTSTPTPAGALMVKGTDGHLIDDTPTASDPYAHYCVECSESPAGRRTVIMEYKSADGQVFTGYFYVTAFEELQIGTGSGARVFRINDRTGTLTEDSGLEPFLPPSAPADLCR